MRQVTIISMEQKFPLGTILITPGAAAALTAPDTANIITRHAQGDWGEVSPDDAELNDLALKDGSRLMSACTVNGVKLWVITEADRSVTTILLPEEY